jgi:hypothetical protein
MTRLIQRVAHLQTGTVDLHVQHVEGCAGSTSSSCVSDNLCEQKAVKRTA